MRIVDQDKYSLERLERIFRIWIIGDEEKNPMGPKEIRELLEDLADEYENNSSQ